MYKHTNCPCCEREIIIGLHDVVGSGHDNWDNKNSWKKHKNISLSSINNGNKLSFLERKLQILSVKPYSK